MEFDLPGVKPEDVEPSPSSARSEPTVGADCAHAAEHDVTKPTSGRNQGELLTMDAPFDPYRELGVPLASSRFEITSAFRQLARRHHTDSRAAAADPPSSDTVRWLRPSRR